jgi:hypothetical protein
MFMLPKNTGPTWNQIGAADLLGEVDQNGQFTGQLNYQSPATRQSGRATGKVTWETDGKFALQLQFSSQSAFNPDLSLPPRESLYKGFGSGEIHFVPAVSGGGISIDQHWEGFIATHITSATDRPIIIADYELDIWPLEGRAVRSLESELAAQH